MLSELAQEFTHAFPESMRHPAMSLRGGNALDEYRDAPPFDAIADDPTDAYLETNCWGIAHLDPGSWKHYIPRLIAYTLVHAADSRAMVIDAFIASLRPPDRDPPRFGSLTSDQRRVLVQFLDAVAFSEDSAWADEAMKALEEYWAPGALYRSAEKEGGSGHGA